MCAAGLGRGPEKRKNTEQIRNSPSAACTCLLTLQDIKCDTGATAGLGKCGWESAGSKLTMEPRTRTHPLTRWQRPTPTLHVQAASSTGWRGLGTTFGGAAHVHARAHSLAAPHPHTARAGSEQYGWEVAGAGSKLMVEPRTCSVMHNKQGAEHWGDGGVLIKQ